MVIYTLHVQPFFIILEHVTGISAMVLLSLKYFAIKEQQYSGWKLLFKELRHTGQQLSPGRRGDWNRVDPAKRQMAVGY